MAVLLEKEDDTKRVVRFDSSIDWEKEALRSVRGWEFRNQQKALQKKESQKRRYLAYRTAAVLTVASILMKSRFSKRLRDACLRSRNLGANVDDFLQAVEENLNLNLNVYFSDTNTTTTTTTNITNHAIRRREEKCVCLKKVHRKHGRRLSNWTSRGARDKLVRLSVDPTFSAEFSRELFRGLGTSGGFSSSLNAKK